MNQLTFRLALLGLIVIGLVHLSSFAVASADVGASDSPTLEGAQVSPENGPWGSTFTFVVTYTDDNGSRPAPGYPKLYLDGAEMVMEVSDQADNDVTDGKVYHKIWVLGKENIGLYSFYYYVETRSGENVRDPATGTDNGPLVEKWSVSLSFEVDITEPATGETVTFSGYLGTTEENLPRENLVLYNLLLDNDVEVSSATTAENGHFTFQLDAPSPGIFFYRARFPGDNYYEASESSRLYVNTLDKPLVFGVYAVILLALVGVLMFLLSRGIARAHYLKPVLLGFGIGFFLLSVGADFIGILAAGGIAGYLFARETPRWTTHLRIGCITGFLFLLAGGLISVAYFLTWAPDVFLLGYSVTQMEVFGILFVNIIFYLVNYSLLVGMGAVLGGTLRKLLKPAEQKPIGSGEATSSGVEQQ